MYLVDTNLVLEVLLRQAKSEEVKRFLERAPSEQLFLTEFSLYSLGILPIRRNLHDVFLRAVEDLLFTGGLTLLRLAPADLADVARRSKQFGLDFDDAYQYVTADKYNLVIVRFDADFDRTARGRKTPQAVLQT
ncbi:PIN domain-containing protein [Candidatus Nitrospira inopinata]|jgi:predicted nucleic acid-binding protein|uniref:Ribonuclease VapC n=1 Tax=Candidatus Nitrospira inopinata TaxID=1715989 RepID=A0A0S4KV58_9BACT|nr:Ribonuclease VapC [Candidatus Nitrospira inopinata]